MFLRPFLAALLTSAPLPVLAASERPLTEGWHFVKSDAAGAEAPAFDDRAWQVVSVPHTYNASDSGIGGAKARGEPEGVYYRGPAWYRLNFEGRHEDGKRYLLDFAGVSLKAEVWLNGKRLGAHKGAPSASTRPMPCATAPTCSRCAWTMRATPGLPHSTGISTFSAALRGGSA